MKKILVTGGYGFIGSEVVNCAFSDLTSLERLVVLDRIDYCSRETNVLEEIRKDERYKFIKGDICDMSLIKSILEDYQIDTIIHMAAQSHVDLSFEDSLKFTKDNVIGTHTLVEASRSYGKLNRFVHMSTDEVYGEATHDQKIPFSESSPLKPTNPYAATKASAEHIVESYGKSHKLPYVIIRGNNVYGGGQYPDKLIGKCSTYLHLNKKFTIHGDGSSKRTFIHVTDMAKGILTVAQKGELGEIYNIGSYNEYSVLEIVKILCKLSGKEFKDSVIYVEDRNHNDKRYFIDHSKVLKFWGGESISFEIGIIDTLTWYKDHLSEFIDI